MSGPIFVDTNVLVYARDASEPERQPVAARWLDALWRAQAGRLSTQVLHEYYVTVTGKLRPGLPVEEARRDVRSLRAWMPIPLGADLIERAWSLQDRVSINFWDALIVAAAHAASCTVLLSEDMQDGMRLDGLRVVDPFAHDPRDVLTG